MQIIDTDSLISKELMVESLDTSKLVKQLEAPTNPPTNDKLHDIILIPDYSGSMSHHAQLVADLQKVANVQILGAGPIVLGFDSYKFKHDLAYANDVVPSTKVNDGWNLENISKKKRGSGYTKPVKGSKRKGRK